MYQLLLLVRVFACYICAFCFCMPTIGLVTHFVLHDVLNFIEAIGSMHNLLDWTPNDDLVHLLLVVKRMGSPFGRRDYLDATSVTFTMPCFCL